MSSILYLGGDCPQMLTDALLKASELLHTDVDSLCEHPDFLYVDEKSLGVADAERIVCRAAMRPVIAEAAVIVVNHFDTMTVQAQNKLLKTVEEGDAILLGVAYADTILETMKSRMRILQYRSEALPEADCVPSDVAACLNSFSSYAPKDILRALHLVKEKDPLSVTADRNVMRYCILAFQNYLYQLLVEGERGEDLDALIRCTVADGAAVRTQYYTKDDFFALVIKIIEFKERRTGF